MKKFIKQFLLFILGLYLISYFLMPYVNKVLGFEDTGISFFSTVLQALLLVLANHLFFFFISKNIVIALQEGEQILRESTATQLVKGWQPKMGKLMLTNQRLIFKSGYFAEDAYKKDFTLNEISDIKISPSLLFLDITLDVALENGEVYKFILNQTFSWKKLMKQSNPSLSKVF